MHGLDLIHCDLKPENILIKSYSRCEIKVTLTLTLTLTLTPTLTLSPTLTPTLTLLLTR